LVHFVTQISWLFWNPSRKRILLISTHDHIQWKNLGQGLKFKMVYGIGFLANFYNISELNSHSFINTFFIPALQSFKQCCGPGLDPDSMTVVQDSDPGASKMKKKCTFC
jgi:hypothetical protein